jgi:hypothetical protein
VHRLQGMDNLIDCVLRLEISQVGVGRAHYLCVGHSITRLHVLQCAYE